MSIPKYDPKNVFELAEAFQQVADDCGAKGIRPDNARDADVAPQVVNASFALELYLKAIFLIENAANPASATYPSSHDLKDIFDLLTDNRRKEITQIAERIERQENPIPSSWTTKYPQLKTVDGCLRFSGEAFNRFRYIYEDEAKVKSGSLDYASPHGFVATHIAKACREYILTIKPEWKR